MRLDAYIRVSRVAGREGPRFISPTVQRERIASWAKASRHEIAEWHEDLDQPGSRADRPGLSAAMERVEAGLARGIVVAKLDRFGRSVGDLDRLIKRLRAANGALFTVAEGIDTSGHTGKLVADILGAIAEWELGRIRENWASARASAVARGAYLAEAPVGYRKLEDGTLVLNPSAPLVAEAFRRRVSGDSWSRIADWLSGEIPARRGGAWSVSAVRRLIQNRAYLGGSHEALVSPSLFEAANAVKGVAPSRSGRASGLLSGILRCAGCRYAMKLSVGRTRHGKLFTEYRCKTARRENASRCEAPASIKSSVAEPFVMDAFWRYVGEVRARGHRPDEGIEEVEQALTSAEAELDAALDRRLVDALGSESDAYLAMIGKRREAVEIARTRMAELRRSAVALPDVNLHELWPDLSLYEQRKLLASALDCVFVRRGTRRPRTWVLLAGEAPELPVRGRAWTPIAFDFPASAEAGA